MEVIDVLRFIGLNFDDDARVFQPGDYRDARDMRIGYSDGANAGSANTFKGNTLIPNSNLPAGDNVCIGSLEDKRDQTLFFFVYNSQDNHGIYRYYKQSNTIEVILISSVLDFDRDYLITGADFVGDLLYWTDYINPQRKINVDKANDTNKLRCSNIYFSPGDAEKRFNVVAVGLTLNTFAITGDQAVSFPKGTTFTVIGSNGNDGTYTVTNDATFDGVNTIITVDEIIPSGAQDGVIILAQLGVLASAFNIILSVKDTSGSVVADWVYRKPASIDNLFDLANDYENEFNNNAPASIKSYVTVTACSNYAVVCLKSPYTGAYTVSVLSTGLSVVAVAQNFYPLPFKEEFIDAIKYPLVCEPAVEYKEDSMRITNYVKNKVFQFRTRLYYDDYEKSVLSPISVIPLDVIPCGNNLAGGNNYIEVDFSDTRLSDTGSLAIIRKVELLVRERNIGKFRSVVVLNQEDFAAGNTKYKFYNDGNYSAIDDALSNKLYDAMPLLSKSQKFVNDRIFYGGDVKGYNNECLDVKLIPEYSEQPSTQTFTIRGTIVVMNPYATIDNYMNEQPIWDTGDGNGTVFGGMGNSDYVNGVGSNFNQRLILNGFTVYLAGTPYYGISKQIIGNNPGIQNASTGVYDGATAAKRKQIRKDVEGASSGDANGNHKGSRTWSTFEIKNVPAGTYIVRVASHLTTEADINDVSRPYEKTSTNCIRVGGTDGSEYVVTVTNSDVYLPGDTEICDLTNPRLGFAARGLVGYTTDKDVTPTPTTAVGLLADKRIELAELTYGAPVSNYNTLPSARPWIEAWDSGSQAGFTDHNGYFFFTADSGSVTVSNIASLGNLLSPTQYNSDGTTPVTAVSTNSAKSIICRNTNSTVSSSSRTKITGTVINSVTGKGVQGIQVLASFGEVQAVTDAFGDFSVTVYGDRRDYPAESHREGILIGANTDANCLIEFSPASQSFDLAIPATYDYTNLYVATNIQAIVLSQNPDNGWKHGFDGQLGIVYFDRANRSTFVNVNDSTKIHLTFFTEKDPVTGVLNNAGLISVSWEIRHLPPSWATHYQWYRTKNQQLKTFLQFAAKAVDFVDADNNVTSYSSGVKIRIDFSNLTDYKDQHFNSQLGYTFQEGDRIRFIKDQNGNIFPDYYDLEVIEFSGGYLYCYKNVALGQIGEGTLFEVYTPKNQDQELVFYEFGECYDIDTDTNGVSIHTGPTQNQSGSDPVNIPATGTFVTGDVYYRLRRMPTANGETISYIEDPSVSDFFPSEDQSIGRIGVVNVDAHQESLPTEIVFSNRYIQDTQVNGLNSFEALNRKQLSNDYGLINKLELSGNEILLAFCHDSKTVSMYIDQAIFRDINGQQVVAISDSVVNSVTGLKGSYGTQNPESVWKDDEDHIYYLDRKKGAAIRYSNNGLFPISEYKAKRYFRQKSGAMNVFEDTEIRTPATFDCGFNKYILSMNPIDALTNAFDGDTIAFATTGMSSNRWTERYGFNPEFYGVIGESVYSFKDGSLWVHDDNALCANYYGIQLEPLITVVSHIDEKKVKIWAAVALATNGLWRSERITIPPTITYPTGMETDIAKSKFRNKEGKLYAEFNRDINTPNKTNPVVNGRRMRGESIEIELKTDETSQISLFEVEVIAVYSEKS